jgi:hypothetical protein
LIRFLISQGKPGAFRAHTVGVGLGLGEALACPDALPVASAAECWLAGVNVLQPEAAIITESEHDSTGSHV